MPSIKIKRQTIKSGEMPRGKLNTYLPQTDPTTHNAHKKKTSESAVVSTEKAVKKSEPNTNNKIVIPENPFATKKNKKN
jgi:hypothetical protein